MGKMTFSNGDEYIGEFEEGLMSGRGEYRWKKGMKY